MLCASLSSCQSHLSVVIMITPSIRWNIEIHIVVFSPKMLIMRFERHTLYLETETLDWNALSYQHLWMRWYLNEHITYLVHFSLIRYLIIPQPKKFRIFTAKRFDGLDKNHFTYSYVSLRIVTFSIWWTRNFICLNTKFHP